MGQIVHSFIKDLARNWTLWVYTLFLLATSLGIFYIDGHEEKTVLGLLSVTQLLIPSYVMIFSLVYYFNSLDFLTLLLAQPIKRTRIILGFSISLSVVFVVAALLGVGIPLVIVAPGTPAVLTVIIGIVLTLIFTVLAVLVGVVTKDKSQGLGITLAILVWFILLFDGVILLIMYVFSDYPVEKIVLFLTCLNPIDLGRITIIMHTDAAALMGYTGAVFEKYLTTFTGSLASLLTFVIWIAVPVLFLVRVFNKKDF